MSSDSDKILLRQLKLIGFPNAEKIKSVENIQSDDFIKITYFILSKIPSVKQQVSEPPTQQQQMVRYSTSLVQIIRSIGFEGSLGFDSFLYPIPEITRNLLPFIIEKIPRQTEKTAQSVSAISPISNAANSAVREFTSAQNKSNRDCLRQDHFQLHGKYQGELKEKIHFREIPLSFKNGFNVEAKENKFSTLLAMNDRESSLSFSPQAKGDSTKKIQHIFQTHTETVLIKEKSVNQPGGRIFNQARFEFSSSKMKKGTTVVQQVSAVEQEKPAESGPKLTPEQYRTIKAEYNQQLSEAKEKISAFEDQSSVAEANIDSLESKISQIKPLLTSIQEERKRLSDDLSKAMKLVELARTPDSEKKDLEKALVNSTSTLLEIAKQFDTPKQNLVNEYRKLSASLRTKSLELSQQVIKLNKIKRMLQEAEEKLIRDSQEIENLKNLLKQIDRDETRDNYIKETLENINAIQKQENEAEKVKVQINSQHQRLNRTIETVKRTWILLDETIYTEAKSRGDQWIKNIYKTVVDLLTLFEGLSEDVEEGGRLGAQIMELESKVVRVESQIDEKAMKRLAADLNQILREIDSFK